jgi:hypothetical protein
MICVNHVPALTRRRNPDASQETWQVYCGDVRVGSIVMRSGNPTDTDPWGWRCGFYPGSHPRDCTSGAAATSDQARIDFEEAWRVFLADHRGRLRRISEAPRLDSLEIRDVGFGMQVSHATSERPVQMLLRCSDRHQRREPARPCRSHGSRMKFVEPGRFTSGLPPVATVGSDIPVRQLRANRRPSAIPSLQRDR